MKTMKFYTIFRHPDLFHTTDRKPKLGMSVIMEKCVRPDKKGISVMKGLIYKITCRTTQQSYIGKTRSTQRQRWYQHCSDAKRGSDKDLHQAIREYGDAAFQMTTLQEWDDISNEALQAAETYFITEHNTFHNGYNMQVNRNAPYPSVLVETRAQVSEHLQSKIKGLMSASLSHNTQLAYQRTLKNLDQYLNGQKLTDSELAIYITYLHDTGKSPATIGQVVAAVKWRLKKADETLHLPVTDTILSGIRREGRDRGRGQVDGLTWQDVERICLLAEMKNTLAGLRDAAMIRLMSDCLLRVSEVVAVNVEDFQEKTLTLRSSKTDQESIGESLYVCDTTRNVLDRYRERAEITDGALFRHIRRGDNIQPNRITAHSARRIIKKRAADAGVKGCISGHSLRVGSAVSLAQAGATVVDMQVAGRWKSSGMPAHYAKAELAERGAIARFKDGKSG